MTTVAFLASAVDPQVASAAAKAALEEFTKQQFDIPSHIQQAHQDQVMKHKEETGKCDPEFGLDKAGIAGYKGKNEEKESTDGMEVDNKENGTGNKLSTGKSGSNKEFIVYVCYELKVVSYTLPLALEGPPLVGPR